MLFRWVPSYRCVSSNHLVKLSFDNKQSVGNVVTDLVELWSQEPVFACSEHESKLWRSLFKKWSDEFSLLSDFAVDWESIVGCWESGWCNRFGSEFLINVVKLAYFLESLLYLSIDFFKLFFWKRSFKNFVLFHENFWKYLVHVNSWNFIKMALVYHGNEVVHFFRVSKISCPYLELHMLFFDLLNQIGKEELHIVLHGVEFRDFCAWIFVKNVFYFTPFHLFAGLVKKGALLPILQSIFANKSRLTTLWIHTYHETRISVYAFW